MEVSVKRQKSKQRSKRSSRENTSFAVCTSVEGFKGALLSVVTVGHRTAASRSEVKREVPLALRVSAAPSLMQESHRALWTSGRQGIVVLLRVRRREIWDIYSQP